MVRKTQTLDVEVQQEGNWWVANIPSLDQVTQARTLPELDEAVCEVASLVTGQPPHTFTVRR